MSCLTHVIIIISYHVMEGEPGAIYPSSTLVYKFFEGYDCIGGGDGVWLIF